MQDQATDRPYTLPVAVDDPRTKRNQHLRLLFVRPHQGSHFTSGLDRTAIGALGGLGLSGLIGLAKSVFHGRKDSCIPDC